MFARKTAVVAAAVALTLTAAAGFAYADTTATPAPTAQTQTQSPDLAAKRQQLADLTKAIKSLQQQVKAQEQTDKALAAKLTSSKTGLAQQIKDLRSQWTAAKGDKAQRQSILAQVKSLLAQRKADVSALQPVKSQVQALRAQAKQQTQSIKDLNTQRKSAEQALKSAQKAKDKVAASAALDQLISVEQQIQAKAQQGLQIAQQIGTVLQSASH